jgi:hypothetical protein
MTLTTYGQMHASDKSSLKRHVEAFGNIGTETGRYGDTAPEFPRCGIGGPHRIAAGTEERIGIRRLGFGGIERISRIGLEDARPFRAAAVGLDVDHFLVVARKRQADLTPEILRGLDVEYVGIRSARRGAEFPRSKATAAGNPLVVAERKFVRGRRCRNQHHEHRRNAQTQFHDMVHSNHPRRAFGKVSSRPERELSRDAVGGKSQTLERAGSWILVVLTEQ